MVYRGKPSAACGECRKRRSKCDQAIPACGQCIKAKRKCPGYRNPADLMFFDESVQVARKSKSRSTGSSSQNEETSTGESSQQLMVQYTKQVRLTDVVMYQPIDDMAVSFFMSSFVGSDPATAQFDYLPSYYAREGYAIPGLQQCLVACGMAGYAKAHRRPDILQQATKNYVVAIRSVNNALSDSISAARESTLLSVIILALFEVLIVPRAYGMRNMTKHLDGAVTIASMCLKNGPPSNMVKRLIATLIQSTIMNCWLQNLPLPCKFFILRKELGGRTNPYSVHANFLDIVAEVIAFEHGIEILEYPLPDVFISRAQLIDEMFTNFSRDLADREPFNTFKILAAPKQLVYGDYYYVYSQPFNGHLWNNIRHSRLRLLQVILAQYNSLLSEPTIDDRSILMTQKSNLEALIFQIARDTCATIPYLAGYLEQLQSYSPIEQQKPQRSKSLPVGSHKKGPRLVANMSSGTVELGGHFVYEPDPFKRTVSLLQLTTTGDADSERRMYANMPRPKMASIYHLLFQLYSLSLIACLPQDMKDWVDARFLWLEAHADQEELGRFKDVMSDKTRKSKPK